MSEPVAGPKEGTTERCTCGCSCAESGPQIAVPDSLQGFYGKLSEIFEWHRGFVKLVGSDSHARQCWERIAESGYDELTLCCFFFLACDFENSPGHTALEPIRQSTGIESVPSIARFVERLQADRNTLVESFGAKEQSALIKLLDQEIELLGFVVTQIRQMASRRTYNPGFYLSCLVEEIRESTGRGHYEEIATVLEVAYAAHGRERPMITGEGVRKVASRFRERAPYIAQWNKNPGTRLMSEYLAVSGVYSFYQNLQQTTQESKPPGHEE